MKSFVTFASVLAVVFVSHAAAAQTTDDRSLEYDLKIDLPITLVGGAAWITTEALKPYLAPAACRWCDRDSKGNDTLNNLDGSFKGLLSPSNQSVANTASNVTGFFLAPAAAVGLDALAVALNKGALKDWAVDSLIIVESAVVAADLNQLVKFTVGRERPFVHSLSPEQKSQTHQPSDNNLSFFSGHTTLTFSLAVASGTVASLRGYRLAPVVWATGLSLSAMTGYLRIAADKHYFTDVATGVVIGSAVGAIVPWLHRSKKPSTAASISGISAAPLSSGAAFGIRGRF